MHKLERLKAAEKERLGEKPPLAGMFWLIKVSLHHLTSPSGHFFGQHTCDIYRLSLIVCLNSVLTKKSVEERPEFSELKLRAHVTIMVEDFSAVQMSTLSFERVYFQHTGLSVSLLNKFYTSFNAEYPLGGIYRL